MTTIDERREAFLNTVPVRDDQNGFRLSDAEKAVQWPANAPYPDTDLNGALVYHLHMVRNWIISEAGIFRAFQELKDLLETAPTDSSVTSSRTDRHGFAWGGKAYQPDNTYQMDRSASRIRFREGYGNSQGGHPAYRGESGAEGRG